MNLVDWIALGSVVLFVLLGTLGVFRRVAGAAVGLIIAALLLWALGALSQTVWFDTATRGTFRDGVVIPYVARRMADIADERWGDDQEPQSMASQP
jgi:MFS superfamily sulfate permease-like transporter